MNHLFNTMPQVGVVNWIGVRSRKFDPLNALEKVEVSLEQGIHGDHYSGKSKKRQVTLIQAEHLIAVQQILGLSTLDPQLTRRNIVIQGINLLALKDCRFRIGNVELETTGFCHPCSRMEENLGPGGYNAMRGHGGITTKVVKGGTIQLGDKVVFLQHLKMSKPSST